MLSRLTNIYTQFKPFFRYCIVGTLGTAIDLGSLYVFVEYLNLHLMFATVCSFLLAVVNNFLLNKFWTFQNRHTNLKKQFIKFLLVSICGLLLTMSLMYVLVYGLALWYMLAKAITSLVVLTWNFLLNKFWTFNDKVWKDFEKKDYLYELSVVIPAYNEAKRIGATLQTIFDYLPKHFSFSEIIVVDDGSKDATVAVVQALKGEKVDLKVISLEQNSGKGAAVKRGVLEASGEYILFMDADNATRIDEVEAMIQILDLNKADVVIGSRYLGSSMVKIKQPWYRVVIGRIGNMLIRWLLLDDIRDTQCGFKIFKNYVAKDIFQRVKITRFGFDIELLGIAQKVLSYRIQEVPVSWYDSNDTRVRPMRAAAMTFIELIWIKVNLMAGRYR